jgi:hypothetical protein
LAQKQQPIVRSIPVGVNVKQFATPARTFLMDYCRNIAISLINLQKGETKAHACANVPVFDSHGLGFHC